jgi:hypothetical protein
MMKGKVITKRLLIMMPRRSMKTITKMVCTYREMDKNHKRSLEVLRKMMEAKIV